MSEDSGPTQPAPETRLPHGVPWRVRPITVADIEKALDGYEAVAAEGRYIGAEVPIDRAAKGKRWAESLENGDVYSLVVGAGDEIVGQAGVSLEIGIADVGMWVLDGWRGAGIGSALLEASIAWARAQGAHKMTLQVWPHNTAAIALYEKYGFEREGLLRCHYRRRSGELWDAVIMGLVLTDGQGQDQPKKRSPVE